MAVIKFIGSIVLVLILLSIPVGMVTTIIEAILNPKGPECAKRLMEYRYFGGTCWGTMGCDNKKCWRRRSCPVCQNEITPEVIAELERVIEERRKELEMKDDQ